MPAPCRMTSGTESAACIRATAALAALKLMLASRSPNFICFWQTLIIPHNRTRTVNYIRFSSPDIGEWLQIKLHQANAGLLRCPLSDRMNMFSLHPQVHESPTFGLGGKSQKSQYETIFGHETYLLSAVHQVFGYCVAKILLHYTRPIVPRYEKFSQPDMHVKFKSRADFGADSPHR